MAKQELTMTEILTTQTASEQAVTQRKPVVNGENSYLIEPDAFYRPAFIRQVFGTRFVNHLTGAGLRAVGGWYWGTEIVEAFRRTRQNSSCQRVPAGKEDLVEAEHAKTKERVEKIAGHNTVQPIPKPTAEDSLRSQLEATRAARRTTTLRSKAV